MPRAWRKSSAAPSLDIVLVLIVFAVVVLVVAMPLRRGRAAAVEASESAQREALEAAKEAKYAEIRDAELDYRTGKLSEADWKRLDRELRSEAIEILRALDEVAPPGTARAELPAPARGRRTNHDA